MNTENNLNYIAIDFETANYCKNSACQIGLVRFENGNEVDSFSTLIKPAKMYFVPEFTQEIHGISYDDVRNKPCFPEIWDNYVIPFINKNPVPFVAHNANFDMNVIRSCCEFYGMEIPDLNYFDSLSLARNIWPELESHKLTHLGEYFKINYSAHDALEDARTCGLVVEKAYAETESKDLNELLKLVGIKIENLQRE